MQEKSIAKYSHADRLKKLRLIRDWKWSEVAKALNISEPMLYHVLNGRRTLGERAEFRLAELERESGIEQAHEEITERNRLSGVQRQDVAQLTGRVMKHPDTIEGGGRAATLQPEYLAKALRELQEIAESDPEKARQVADIISTFKQSIPSKRKAKK